jgi:hypothetical protein
MGALQKRLVLGATSASILVLLVSACASGSPIASSPPTVAETPTPSATAVAAVPQPTLPLDCASIFTDEAATAIVGVPVRLVVNETTLRGIDSVAARQSGLLKCIWGGETRTDNGWDDHLELTVLPNAAADYDKGVMKVDDGAVDYTAGTLSEYLCRVYESGGECRANLLVNNYWVHGDVLVAGGSTMDFNAAESGSRAFLDRMAALVPSTTARPAWVVPSGALTGAYCTPADLSVYTDHLKTFPADLEIIALLRTAATRCDGVRVVPGGAWAVPVMAASPPPLISMLGILAPTPIAGMDSAVAACGAFCEAIGVINGSAVEISVNDKMSMADFIAYASAKAAEIRAAG